MYNKVVGLSVERGSFGRGTERLGSMVKYRILELETNPKTHLFSPLFYKRGLGKKKEGLAASGT